MLEISFCIGFWKVYLKFLYGKFLEWWWFAQVVMFVIVVESRSENIQEAIYQDIAWL
jgi:hypothetical protein